MHFLAITSSPTTTTAPAVTHLTGVSGSLALWLTVGLIVAAGIVIAFSRVALEGRGGSGNESNGAQTKEANRPDRTLIRSWLAIPSRADCCSSPPSRLRSTTRP
jgi:hypothetical protein